VRIIARDIKAALYHLELKNIEKNSVKQTKAKFPGTKASLDQKWPVCTVGSYALLIL
jgi:hypothetical protein